TMSCRRYFSCSATGSFNHIFERSSLSSPRKTKATSSSSSNSAATSLHRIPLGGGVNETTWLMLSSVGGSGIFGSRAVGAGRPAFGLVREADPLGAAAGGAAVVPDGGAALGGAALGGAVVVPGAAPVLGGVVEPGVVVWAVLRSGETVTG